MNDYIEINDGTNTYKYKATARSWRYKPDTPSTTRVLLSGELDITYGPSQIDMWEGELKCPNGTQPAGWGNIDNLRTQLARKVVFQFRDHYNNLFTTASIEGPFKEESISPMWDGAENEILVTIRVTAV